MDFCFAGVLARRARQLSWSRLRDYPAVAVVGPCQCGKTTLARSLGGHYFDLEQDGDRPRLDLVWDDVAAGRTLAVLDEAQAWPEAFARLRGTIDRARKRKGRFLLLGSVSPTLMTQVSESLAGRLSLVELTPLLHSELETTASRRRRWLCGGCPEGGVLTPRSFPQWQRDYLALLTQRDLPAWELPAKPQTTLRLLRMLAALHGQVWNASQVGQSLGVSYHTVNSYVDFLEGAFLVRRLPSYQPSIRKRLVKSPKVYWRDTGLLHTLLGATDDDALLAQPWVGASWEGHVVEQTIGALLSRGIGFEPYFFRTSDGREVDLVLDWGTERWAVEVKLSASPGPRDLKRLDEAADLIDASRRFLVCRVREAQEAGPRVIGDLDALLERLPRA